jgi:peptide deformylase
MILDIVKWPSPELKVVCEDVTFEEMVSEEIRTLVQNMLETAAHYKAQGIAAPQVGVPKNIIIYQSNRNRPVVLYNPVIIGKRGKHWSRNEGCLSVPGFRADIKRFKEITISTFLEKDEAFIFPESRAFEPIRIRIKARPFESVVIQHEMDHLNGIEFIDRLPDHDDKKKKYIKKLQGGLK